MAIIIEQGKLVPPLNISFPEFEKDVIKVTNVLVSKGVCVGDRVILKSKNSYAFCVAFFSLIVLDASILLIDDNMPDNDLLSIYERADVKHILSDRVHLSIPSIYMEGLLDFQVDQEIYRKVSLSSWLKRKDAVILFSSGSTGEPKGIVHSGFALLENIKQTQQVMKYRSDDVLLPLLPFSHFYGLSILLLWWSVRCTLVITKYQMLRNIVDVICDFNVTVVDTVSSVYYKLLKLFERRSAYLKKVKRSTVRMWCVGGAPLSESLDQAFYKMVGLPLLDGYGMSEVGNIALRIHPSEKGCGKPLPNVEVQIISNDGTSLPADQIGEIYVRSPSVMELYLNQEQETERAKQKGWFKTEDIGYFDRDGNLHVLGRKGITLNRNGYIFYPANIENKVNSLGFHSKIIPFNKEKEETYIVLCIESGDQSELSLSTIRKQINQSLPSYMYPDTILLFGQFPLKSNGKIDVMTLTNWVQSQIQTGGLQHA